MYVCMYVHIDIHTKKLLCLQDMVKLDYWCKKKFSATNCCQNSIYVQTPGHSGEWRVFSLDPFDSDEVNAIHSSMSLSEVQFANNRRETVGI